MLCSRGVHGVRSEWMLCSRGVQQAAALHKRTQASCTRSPHTLITASAWKAMSWATLRAYGRLIWPSESKVTYVSRCTHLFATPCMRLSGHVLTRLVKRDALAYFPGSPTDSQQCYFSIWHKYYLPILVLSNVLMWGIKPVSHPDHKSSCT